MTKTVPYLFVLICHIFLPAIGRGQCGYPATIHTNKNYCLGSSLIASSPDALERIVWYKDGQPVDSTLARQSLASQAVTVTLKGSGVGGDIAADESGNIYTIDFDRQRIVKWTPGAGTTVTTVGSFPWNDAHYIRLFVDHLGNIYAASPDFPQVLKYTPGDTVGVTMAGSGGGLFVDCAEAIYLSNYSSQTFTKWPPGATSGTVVASASGQPGVGGPIHVDSNGRMFSLIGSEVAAWSPGATNGTPVATWDNHYTADAMWMDGKDTAWVLTLPDIGGAFLSVLKIAPGASAAVIAGTCPSHQTFQDPGITMDTKGNIFAIDGDDQVIYELKRTTAIDTAFVPTSTGAYYAVVTNIRGYAATTNTIVINTPQSGQPSISVAATATSTPVCTPIDFTATPVNAGIAPAYQWQVSGVPVGSGGTTYSNSLFANGDQVYCIMTAQAGCSGPVVDTSNIITLGIDAQGAASVTIAAAPKTIICEGQPVTFTASVMNGSANPVFQWLLNGDSIGDDSSTFARSNFSNNDVVTCLITSDDICGLAKSNSIPVTVSIPPVIQPGQIFTIPRGGSLQLDPVISGTVDTWAWAPGNWLSDSTIANPVADPPATMTYTLMVAANGGCGDTATVLVDVFTPLAIPNAFSPNGDGRNDRLYVLGGPVNSVVETFAVFNRWGQAVFQAHDIAPGDANAGWDGRLHGSFVPPGTYVYVVVMRFATGSRQTYRGTVEVIR